MTEHDRGAPAGWRRGDAGRPCGEEACVREHVAVLTDIANESQVSRSSQADRLYGEGRPTDLPYCVCERLRLNGPQLRMTRNSTRTGRSLADAAAGAED